MPLCVLLDRCSNVSFLTMEHCWYAIYDLIDYVDNKLFLLIVMSIFQTLLLKYRIYNLHY